MYIRAAEIQTAEIQVAEEQATGLVQPVNSTAKPLRIQSWLPDHVHTIWNYVIEQYGNDFERSFSVFAPGSPDFDADVLEMSLHDSIAACENDLINLLPFNQLLPDRVEFRDYRWNALQPCAIGHSVWADVITFDHTAFIEQNEPVTLRDFFDVDRFPGKRAVRMTARGLAEWSLELNGTARQNLYKELSTDSAWEKIQQTVQLIESEIIWVESDQQALQLLDSGEVTFALVTTSNVVKRVSQRIQSDMPHDHYRVIWSAAIAHMGMLVIPRDNAKRKAKPDTLINYDDSIDFLRYVTQPLNNLRMATAFGYAPGARVLDELIDNTYRKLLPLGRNLDSVIWRNDKWWRENGAELETKFQQYFDAKNSVAAVEM